jgi:nucleoside-diphosphate-sugar epimerase
VSRTAKSLPASARQVCCDVSDSEHFASLFDERWDFIVITMSPQSRTEEGYRRTYYNTVHNCLEMLEAKPLRPQAIIYISSTSVYGEGHAERVDESTPTNPLSATAKVLLETESLLRSSDIPSCVLRLSGIYGPNRFRLLQQVFDGVSGDDGYTNRIHAEDAASLIVFLLSKLRDGESVPELLLGSDGHAVKSADIRLWLAREMALPNEHLIPNTRPPRASTNRIIDNATLLALGFTFRYPSYKEGFRDIVRAFLATKKQA